MSNIPSFCECPYCNAPHDKWEIDGDWIECPCGGTIYWLDAGPEDQDGNVDDTRYSS